MKNWRMRLEPSMGLMIVVLGLTANEILPWEGPNPFEKAFDAFREGMVIDPGPPEKQHFVVIGY